MSVPTIWAAEVMTVRYSVRFTEHFFADGEQREIERATVLSAVMPSKEDKCRHNKYPWILNNIVRKKQKG